MMAFTEPIELPHHVAELKANIVRRDGTIAKQAPRIAVLEQNVEIFRQRAFGPSSKLLDRGVVTRRHLYQAIQAGRKRGRPQPVLA